jgi:hypothetical protein
MKKILFRPSSQLTETLLDPPTTSISKIPDWFKKLPKTVSGESFPNIKGRSSDLTVKPCIPFFDSITSGYMLTTPADMVFTLKDGVREVNWPTPDFQLIGEHTLNQLGSYEIPEEYEKHILKWNGFWGIQTPPGYSLLFMHPLGRPELPFYSFHGIVDSDKHYVPINIPFVLRKGFVGVIPKGTPYAQVIPIKRESWHSKKKNFLDNGFDPNNVLGKVHLYAEKWYKKNIWERKKYY